MDGPNQNSSDKKNPAKGKVWVYTTKRSEQKNPAKGGIWVNLSKTVVIKQNPAKWGVWVDYQNGR